MNKLIPSLAFAGLSLALGAQAETNTGVYIPFGVMGYDYDESTRVLEPSFLPTLGIGYRFDDRFATELMIAHGSADVDQSGGGDADVRHYRVDGLYFMDDRMGVTPYLVGGLGENEVDYDITGSPDDTLVNAGAGLMYQADYNWSFRGDVRAIHSLDYNNTEGAFNLLAQYNFGSPAKAVQEAPADDDRDGVVNSKDLCPTTPPNKSVDRNGCDCNYVLHLGFDFDSAELHADDIAILDRLSQVLENLGYVHANIVGHTDSQGEEAYNQALSERRAQVVTDYFVNTKGLNKDMFTPIGRGETQPAADNGSEAGRAENRRIVLERDDCGK